MKGADVIVGHIPESLSEVLSPFMVIKTKHIEAVVDSEYQPAPEGTWTPGGGIEIPCTYKIYSAKFNKRVIKRKIRNA